MDNEKEIEFDFVLFSMGTRCMSRARDGIPHDTKRQVAWATNTQANWMNGNGPTLKFFCSMEGRRLSAKSTATEVKMAT